MLKNKKLLQTAVKDTSEKINTLKEADKQTKVQLENGELGQDKYDALQREIIETEQQFEKFGIVYN